mmetsp:Transcript_137964/g.326909  ORF Transcript_137964/g.326909 Transcript_137964/m.326909 type:complete len:200 (-) Transcript_137964:31-630(-)
MSWSIFRKIRSSSLKSSSASSSISIAIVATSFKRCSAKVSTTTATTRFRTPKTMVKWEPTKMLDASHGSSDMSGTATSPHLSPATTVLNMSKTALMTDDKEARQDSQSSHSPSFSMREVMVGYSSSTMSIAQEVITTKQKMKDHIRVLKQRPVIRTSFRSSLSILNFRKRRNSRKMRTTRRMRRSVTSAASIPTVLKTS